MFDGENLFSNRQTLAAGASENTVDLGARDAGPGRPAILSVILSGGAAGALIVTLTTGDDSALADGRTAATYAIPAALAARGGAVLAAALPSGLDRYLRLGYAGSTGGTVTAGLVQGAETPR